MALKAVRGLKTLSELAAFHKVHPTQITRCKTPLFEDAETVLESDSPNPASTDSSQLRRPKEGKEP